MSRWKFSRAIATALLALLSGFWSAACLSATFEVTTTAEFRAALDEAAFNSEDDTIHLADGTYSIADDGGVPFQYAPFGGSQALEVYGDSPETVVISGGGLNQVFVVSGGRQFTLSNVTVRDGNAPATTRGGGLYAQDTRVVINGVIFEGNASLIGGALAINNSGQAQIIGSRFGENTAEHRGCSINFLGAFDTLNINRSRFLEEACGSDIIRTELQTSLLVSNSTIAGPDQDAAFQADAINFYRGYTLLLANVVVANVMDGVVTGGPSPGNQVAEIWNSAFVTRRLDVNATYELTAFAFNSFIDPAKINEAPIVSLYGTVVGKDPGFVNASNGDFRLKKSSILVDAGSEEAPALSELDLAGQARVQGRTIDIGAHELQLSDPTALPDINGNGSPELGMLMHGGTQVHVRDGSSGEQVAVIDIGEDAALSFAVLPDLDLSGSPELALLTKQSDGQVVVHLHDSETGSLFKSIYYGKQYEPVAMRVIDDYSNNGVPEIAVMGSDSTDALRLQIKDTGTGNFLDNVFLGNQGIGHDFVAVPDINSNGKPELAVLSVLKGNEQIRTQIWDAADATFQGNIWFGKVYEPFKLLTMPDINGNGADEIVAMGIDRATQNLRVQVRDTGTSDTHYNIWLGAVNDAVDIASINDINADGIADLAILLSTPDGKGRARVQSGKDGSFIRNLFFSAISNPTGLAVMPDYSGNGFEELAVLGENAGTRHVQILDTSTGTQVNRIDFP